MSSRRNDQRKTSTLAPSATAQQLLADNTDAASVSRELLRNEKKDERKSRKSVSRKRQGIDTIARKSAAGRVSAFRAATDNLPFGFSLPIDQISERIVDTERMRLHEGE